jgi:hypothetical protein
VGAPLWLVASPSRLWRQGGAASSCIGFAWRGVGVLGVVRLFLSSSSWLLGGGSFSEVGGARHLARDRELLSGDLWRLSVASSGPQGSRASTPTTLIMSSWRSLVVLSQVACSLVAGAR